MPNEERTGYGFEDPTDISGCPTIRQGTKGDAVKTMQRLLVQAGSSLTVDGVFGRGTRSAVMAFQRKKGLDADGVCGPETWTALVNHYVINNDTALYTVILEHISAKDAESLLKKYDGQAMIE